MFIAKAGRGSSSAACLAVCVLTLGGSAIPWVHGIEGGKVLVMHRGERIHGEFIHTTPGNEAEEAMGEDVELGESHGCVHIKPSDLDDMVNRRFLKKGSVVVVHRYAESRIPYARPKVGHGAPYEVHFYPGLRQMCVVGVERL